MSMSAPVTTAPRIRRARSLDLPEVAALWADCGLVPPSLGFHRELQRKLHSDPELFLLAIDPAAGGRIVGALLGGFDGRTATVSRLTTHPDRRGEGVAAALVEAFVGELAALGGADVRVVLLDGLAETQALWEALGHRPDRPLAAFRLD
jgi:ribosomal protein S18 acetylase RimI-like enzyme